MKSQDIVILLKLVSLYQRELSISSSAPQPHSSDWKGWNSDSINKEEFEKEGDLIAGEERLLMGAAYTSRGLSASLGISKTEVNASIKRSVGVGLAMFDRKNGYPRSNTRALSDFIIYGLKYVYPAEPGKIVRGIPTSFAAPVLAEQLMSAGEFIYVWADPRGKDKGQAVLPLYKSVPEAVKRDPKLYEFLALIDAIRMGNPRESKVAAECLKKRLRGKP